MAATFIMPNPYASGPSNADITVRKLIVFGDSFSKKNRKAFHNWAEQLRYDEMNQNTNITLTKALADFALSGATAGNYPDSTNNFAHQVTRWLATAPTFGKCDLTVVYLGYNDIDNASDPNGADLANVTVAGRRR